MLVFQYPEKSRHVGVVAMETKNKISMIYLSKLKLTSFHCVFHRGLDNKNKNRLVFEEAKDHVIMSHIMNPSGQNHQKKSIFVNSVVRYCQKYTLTDFFFGDFYFILKYKLK